MTPTDEPPETGQQPDTASADSVPRQYVLGQSTQAVLRLGSNAHCAG